MASVRFFVAAALLCLSATASAQNVTVTEGVFGFIGEKPKPVVLQTFHDCLLVGKMASPELGKSTIRLHAKICKADDGTEQTEIDVSWPVSTSVRISKSSHKQANYLPEDYVFWVDGF